MNRAPGPRPSPRLLVCLLGWVLICLLLSTRTAAGEVHGVGSLLAPEFYEDAGGLLTVEDVSNAERLPWRPLAPSDVNRGYTAAAYWLRFTLAARALDTRYLEVYQSIDDALLFERDARGAWHEQHLGRGLPFHSRSVPHKNLYFPLALSDGAPRTYYLRLQTADTLQLGLRVLTTAQLARTIAVDNLVTGLYLGAVLGLALYNLAVFAWLRDRAYLYYVVFQLATACLQASLDQVTFRFLWPAHPAWAAQSETVFVGLAIFGAAGFARYFLAMGSRAPRLQRSLKVVQGLALLLAALYPITASVQFASVAMVFVALACALLLGAGIVAWRRGEPNAPFFVVAWSLLLTGTIVASLTGLGALSTIGLAQESTRVGSVLEALLLSLGLAHRINRMRRENERAQAALVQVRTEEAARLEERVTQRTCELEAALGELRTAQVRLSQQARLASLGHLVAGVVHEVGNPLNFIQGGSEELTFRLGTLRGQLAEASARGDPGLLDDARGAVAAAATAAELIANGNQRIHQIVRNLRSLVAARPAGVEPTDLREVLEQTLALLQVKLDQRGIQVHRNLSTLPEIPCRSGEMGQVFMNLLLNSYQALPDGGSIWVEARASRETLEVVVKDDGPGVPEDAREAIFDPFFTTRPPNEGLGLGLSICHEIVTRHGGSLRLAEGAVGAVFVMTLPVRHSVATGQSPD